LDITLNDLKKYKHIHLIGIGGISMSAIAETLLNWGFIVTGSDASSSEITDRLISHGATVTIGHDLENSKKADLIIYSAAINDEDPEIILAKENNIKLVGRGEFVGWLTKLYKEAICISGTHGKTTTTSMISVCFVEAKKDPTIQVGALLKNIGGNYRVGNSEYFILESCEYKANFLKFIPNTEVILNIDNDHLDFYKTFDNIVKAFREFASIPSESELVVTNADDENCLNLKDVVKGHFVTYGINNQNANFVAKNISFDDNGFATFDVYKNKEFFEKISLSVAGKHNILNALACTAVCDFYNIDTQTIATALKKFTGAERRLEYKGSYNGFSVFDDYGHHPTEILATANAIKNKKYNESWVIFQPHTYSRTKTHLDAFAKVLENFDHVILVDIYAAREKNTFEISSQDVVNKMIENGKQALYMTDFKEVAEYIRKNAKPKDLVLTLGAGTVTNIGPMIVE
jgi:UDP-N-acetylmuramate--alanine ligase